MSKAGRAQSRFEALTLASTRKPHKFQRPKRMDGSYTPISEFFGCNTFGFEQMEKKLLSTDVAILKGFATSRSALPLDLAEKVAVAVKEWAVSRGATHYCHWFQPQTGATAEKHDSFFSLRWMASQ